MATTATAAYHVGDVQLMRNGYGFSIGKSRMSTAPIHFVYATEVDAEAARELVVQALANVVSVEIVP